MSKAEGISVQGIDSGASARGKSPFSGLEPAEARARAQEREADRHARAKTMVPERTLKLLEGIPPKYRSRAIKIVVGDATVGERIKANCAQCIGWEEVEERVRECRSFACSFWGVRPYRAKGEPE